MEADIATRFDAYRQEGATPIVSAPPAVTPPADGAGGASVATHRRSRVVLALLGLCSALAASYAYVHRDRYTRMFGLDGGRPRGAARQAQDRSAHEDDGDVLFRPFGRAAAHAER